MKRNIAVLSLISLLLFTASCKDGTAPVTGDTPEQSADESGYIQTTAPATEDAAYSSEITAEDITEEAEVAVDSAESADNSFSGETAVEDTPETSRPWEIDSEYNDIVLTGADKFQQLLNSYLPVSSYLGTAEPGFDLGDTPLDSSGAYYEVISDNIRSYEDLKSLFTGIVTDEYADFLLKENIPCYKEFNKLCFCKSESSCIGILDAWYLGCRFDGEHIAGYFAALLGMETEWAHDADFLNDPRNYHYYEMVFEPVDDNWRICDVRYMHNDLFYTQGTHDSNGYVTHGCFYNAGTADRSLITYKAVIPYPVE